MTVFEVLCYVLGAALVLAAGACVWLAHALVRLGRRMQSRERP